MPKPETAIREIIRHFDHLASRWQDEHEHEDFRDYKEAMRKFLEQREASMVEMTAAPAMLVFTLGTLRHVLTFRGDTIILRVLNKPLH